MDLVISAHVLEHLNSPIDEINNLLTYGANIYIEVPLGLPSPNWRRRNLVLNKIIIIFSNYPGVYKRITNPAAGRVPIARKGWLDKGMLRQSEHINFFSKEGFESILNQLKLNYKIEVSEIPTPDGSISWVLQILITT